MIKVDNAVIMAAGKSERFVPLSYETPKGLLEVRGEIMIERQIRQLKEAGIDQIYVVTGHMAEKFSYLEGTFGVHLIENPDYVVHNNHSSIWAARHVLKNSYVCSADNYFTVNPFTKEAEHGYYSAMYADGPTHEWCLTTDDSDRIIDVTVGGENTWYMMGHVLWDESFSRRFLEILEQVYDLPETKDKLWEDIYREHLDELSLIIHRYRPGEICEFDTLDELRAFDDQYIKEPKSEVIAWLCEVMNCQPGEIQGLRPVNKGMTNHTCYFTLGNREYLLRIPGEGTADLIDRRQEAEVYRAIAPYDLCDKPVAFDEKKGYRLTYYLKGVRCCDPYNTEDIRKCMQRLRAFHQMRIVTEHTFDLFGKIVFYETLRGGAPSVHADYVQIKEQVFALRSYIDTCEKERCLAHIDSVPDNFLFYTDESGNEKLQLSDWEYAGMQDPHVDLAMFIVHSGYDRQHTDELMDVYFENRCPDTVRTKIYCYIAACGLLWSNWCEYKQSLGVTFGEYAQMQYDYAKTYYVIARKHIQQ